MAPVNLLDLPAELRNRIFEYALIADAGHLFYREILDCGNAIVDGTLTPIKPSSDEGCVNYYNAPNIYGAKLCVTADPSTEFCQLKYVCRQLRRETSRIAIQLNAVIFLDDATYPISPEMQFARFYRRCDKSWSSKMRKVVLRSKNRKRVDHQPTPFNGNPVEGLENRLKFYHPNHPCRSLFHFCVTNPHTEVRYHRADLWPHPGDILWKGLVLTHVRVRKLIPVKLCGDRSIATTVLVPELQRSDEVFDPCINDCPNLRLFPHDDELDETLFESEPAALFRITISMGHLGIDLETCNAEIKRIYAEGM